MATTCFCGCGRTVRFAKKKMSTWGAEATKINDVLERVSLRIVKDDPDAQGKVKDIIKDGYGFQGVWEDIIHGDMPAPPAQVGLEFREQFFVWKENAGGLAASHADALLRADAEEKARHNPAG